MMSSLVPTARACALFLCSGEPKPRRVTLIAADSPSSFLDGGPTSNWIRQILGAVSEFDKAMIVAKLKGARDRVRRAQGKCEGRKAYAEREGGKELVALVRKLRDNLNGESRSLRKIAADLAGRGCVTPSGRPHSASAIASMVGRRNSGHYGTSVSVP